MASSPLSVHRFRMIFNLGWIFLLGDFTLLLKWYGWPWKIALVDAFISNFFLFVNCMLIMNTLRYYTPKRERYVNLLGWCVILTGAWLLLSRWVISLALKNVDGYVDFLNSSLIIRASIVLLLTGCMTLAFVLWYNWEEQKENEKRKGDAEKLAKEAELFKLRQQLQPHFLFNSLNSINALIGARPEEARKMVQQLSDFLRGTIRKEENQWASLQEELQYLQLYLEIEKVRFGNRLHTIIESDEPTNKLQLPAMLLQPIVENAIKFGLYDTTGETIIRLTASKSGNDLLIRVENPFDPETSSPKQGIGFGLQSIDRRLYLLFARTGLLKTETKENIFITTVLIPQRV
ncbi:MAG TPA: histidine kinase [Chitinophagaceae bacterium]|nr:histidine kinase [Chitinophagaceae bacterium]